MKAWYESKTVWTNLLTFGVGVLMMFQEQFKDLLETNPWLAGTIVVVVAAANGALRFVTNTGVFLVKNGD